MPLREPVSPLVLLQAAPAPTGNRNARRTTGRKEDRRDKPVGNSVPSLPTSKRYLSRKQRSEEHTSELQSRQYLVCRLLLEKKQPHIRICFMLIAYHDHVASLVNFTQSHVVIFRVFHHMLVLAHFAVFLLPERFCMLSLHVI